MNQALYAHMNNKRKMKKKKELSYEIEKVWRRFDCEKIILLEK
jgi:hypothetical protein